MSILLVGLFISTIDARLLLQTSSGLYQGQLIHYRQRIVHRYLAIPYGRIIERFSRAVPIDNRMNSSIINATSLGSICKPSGKKYSINYGIFSLRSTSPDEQCLFLNLFIPISRNSSEKSILVWIHGGSGQMGTGNLFDGSLFAALADVILVTFNYRLNLFGFLSTGDQQLEGNVGLYDQALLLDWIDENCSAIGGDRQRITVAGHSIGASYAYFLALSPFNRGRIRRLILQSGSPFNSWAFMQSKQAKERFEIVANDNGCKGEEILKCLREKPFDRLYERNYRRYTTDGHTNVVLNGEFMKEFQRELKGEDRLEDIDVMIGSNEDEGIFMAMVPILMEPSKSLETVNLTEIALKFLGVTRPKQRALYHQALQLYQIDPISSSCSSFYNYSRLISDILFYNDYYRFLLHRLSHGKTTYLYQYAHRTSYPHPSSCHDYLYQHRHLVGHFAELEYTWGIPLFFDKRYPMIDRLSSIDYHRYPSNTTDEYSIEQMEFSEELIERWSKFIHSGQGWKSMNEGWMIHIQLNQTQLKPFHLPDHVQFWLTSSSSSIWTFPVIILFNHIFQVIE